MTEVWASAPREYHEFYEISNLGGARSLPRVTRGRNGSERTAPGKLLAKRVNPRSGYVQYVLSVRGKVTYEYAHSLVLEAFVSPRPSGMDSCHWNGVRDDNRLENLRWDTRTGNFADKIRHGTSRGWKSEATHCPSKHPYAGENLKIRTYDGARICVECSRRWAREHYHRKKVRNE